MYHTQNENMNSEHGVEQKHGIGMGLEHKFETRKKESRIKNQHLKFGTVSGSGDIF